MKIYDPPHRFHGLTWRIVWVVYCKAVVLKKIGERPSIQFYQNGEQATLWRGERFPDVSRDEVLTLAKEFSDPSLLQEPNFGKRSLAILHAAMGGYRLRAEWTLEKQIKHLSNDNRRKVASLVDRLLRKQERTNEEKSEV